MGERPCRLNIIMFLYFLGFTGIILITISAIPMLLITAGRTFITHLYGCDGCCDLDSRCCDRRRHHRLERAADSKAVTSILMGVEERLQHYCKTFPTSTTASVAWDLQVVSEHCLCILTASFHPVTALQCPRYSYNSETTLITNCSASDLLLWERCCSQQCFG